MSDPISLLLEAIEARRGDAPKIHHNACRSVSYVGVTEGSACNCGEPERVLRRSETDRVTVQICGHTLRTSDAATPKTLARLVLSELRLGYGLTEEEK